MGYCVIKFEKKQEGDVEFDETMLDGIHVLVDANNDYTLCGHATDEYNIRRVKKNPTCPNCIRMVKDCRAVKLRAKDEDGSKKQGKGGGK